MFLWTHLLVISVFQLFLLVCLFFFNCFFWTNLLFICVFQLFLFNPSAVCLCFSIFSFEPICSLCLCVCFSGFRLENCYIHKGKLDTSCRLSNTWNFLVEISIPFGLMSFYSHSHFPGKDWLVVLSFYPCVYIYLCYNIISTSYPSNIKNLCWVFFIFFSGFVFFVLFTLHLRWDYYSLVWSIWLLAYFRAYYLVKRNSNYSWRLFESG